MFGGIISITFVFLLCVYSFQWSASTSVDTIDSLAIQESQKFRNFLFDTLQLGGDHHPPHLHQQSLNDHTLSSVSSTSQPASENEFGYLYSELYGEASCNSTIWGMIGLSTQTCLRNGSYSYSVSFTQEDCSDLTVNTYSDYYCQNRIHEQNIYANISQCFVYEKNRQVTSQKFMCSLGSKIPITVASILVSFYNNNSFCAGNTDEFFTFTNNHCLSQIGWPVNYSIPIKSFIAECVNDGFKIYGYPSSTTCTGTEFSKSFPDACHPITDELAPQFPNASVSSTCISLTTSSPTVHPTAKPTVRPTAVPTANYVSFTSLQTINGIDYATYMSNQTAYQSTLVNAIAACMEGIDTSNILNLVVSSDDGRRKLRSSQNKRQGWIPFISTTDDAIDVSYVVSTTEVGVTYSSLSSELNTNIANGDFSGYLTFYSGVYSTPGFINVTSSAAVTSNNLASSSNNSSGLQDGAIVGIVVGGFAGVVILIALGYWSFSQRSKNIPSHRKNYPSKSSSIDIPGQRASELSKMSSNGGSSIEAEGVKTIQNHGIHTVSNPLIKASAITAMPMDGETNSSMGGGDSSMITSFIQDNDAPPVVVTAVVDEKK